jgi:hypothetical protein
VVKRTRLMPAGEKGLSVQSYPGKLEQAMTTILLRWPERWR